MKMACWLARARVKAPRDDVVKALRMAVVLLNSIDEGIWTLTIALVVDDAIVQGQRWLTEYGKGKSLDFVKSQEIGDRKLAESFLGDRD